MRAKVKAKEIVIGLAALYNHSGIDNNNCYNEYQAGKFLTGINWASNIDSTFYILRYRVTRTLTCDKISKNLERRI
jgi:hypothetical protein